MASIPSTRHLLPMLLAQQQPRLPLSQKLAVLQAVPMGSAEASSVGGIGGLLVAWAETALCPLAKGGLIGSPLSKPVDHQGVRNPVPLVTVQAGIVHRALRTMTVLWLLSLSGPLARPLTTSNLPLVLHSPSSNAEAAEGDTAQRFHAAELAGRDQDTLPIIVENTAKEPITLLADIDLALAENYISSRMLSALGISPTASELTPIAKKDRRPAALATPAFKVTPEAKITLNLLTQAETALKQFADVEFNVFDLPPISERGGVPWEPEAFLGVVSLREASALRLVDGFVGHAALEGLPVLVRNMTRTDSAGGECKEGGEGWEKDEL
ncbi:uncharacterized protein Z519_00744 [Cladophialophora bantiana CBS 173.52]|uniref:Uncharacterized protein n=1 Tax=Cladophialophora bantiana (strain ATCC 10958 / CBS 173.52 / CDC B-1940 / NIH 8579) TaxID=1442370 RepID=A0A0D2FAG4_CLAB1|nr:uncharacterized protein Z519_00744 [Cladophialophora bantiana CBS 173.52]KIW99081.1 hypothetical protein Z519_00744 [Cladophialophora bantiana CBS 173.52]